MPAAPLPDMPPVQYAQVNGIRMAYYEAGPKGVGTPIVFSHGFPEIAYSWRHQIKLGDRSGSARLWLDRTARGHRSL
jgi:pimeloyl-ACP methyl ester carboxylesterase